MVSRKSGIIIAAIVTLFSFVSVAYLSCTKPDPNLHSCNGVICENGGYCLVDTSLHKPRCVCPTGFEGSNCATPAVAKYIDTWDLTQTITGSDSTSQNGHAVTYTVSLQNSATPTTFFINNFSGNPYYNQIVCTLDSSNSYIFTIDTISAAHMVFDHFTILAGSGSISSSDSVITAYLRTRHLTATSNWENDTIVMVLKRHQF